MQLTAPFPTPVRRFTPFRGFTPMRVVAATAAVAVLAAGGAFGYQRLMAPAPAAPLGQVVPVRRATIAATVNATGSVVPTKTSKLVFGTSGRIKDILVNVGDRVEANQPLARLQADALQLKLDTARSQLATSQLKLQALLDGAVPEDVAAAQAGYDAAMAKLTQVESGATDADLRAAEAGVASAQASLDQSVAKLQALESGAPEADLASARASLESARNGLAVAEARLEQLQAGPTEDDVVAAQSTVEQSRASLRSAEAKLAQVRGGSTNAEIVAAQASADQAQATLTSARAKLDQVKATAASPADVAAAEASLASAEAKLQSAHQAMDQKNNELLQARANLVAQESAVRSAKATADSACEQKGEGAGDCLSARSRLDAAQPQLLAAEQRVRDLNGPNSWEMKGAREDVLAAQSSYDAARVKLNQVRAANSIPADVIAAQSSYDGAVASLNTARAKLDQVKSGALAADLAAAQSSVESARAGLTGAEAKLRTVTGGATSADRVAAETAVETARAQVAAAEAKLAASGVSTPQDLTIARASISGSRASLESARAKLDALQAGATTADVESARGQVASARAALVTKAGPARQSDVLLQQEAVRQAEISVRQAQLDVDNATLVAPFPGVVGLITGNVGEQAPSGANGFLVLIDPREVRVDVTVDESDVAKIQQGKVAQITFEALPGRPFRGRVMAVSPNGTINQGVVTYPVSIAIEGRDRDQVLPAGLTATTVIVIDQKENVLTVPQRAVRRQGREQVVDVLGADGKPVTRPVRTGVASEQQVEVVEGLQEGDQVVIPATTTRAPNANLGGGGQGGPGGGGPGGGGPVIVTKPHGQGPGR